MDQKLFLNLQEMAVDHKLRIGIPGRFIRVLKKICPDHWDRVGLSLTPEHSIKVMPYPVYEEELEAQRKLSSKIGPQRRGRILSASFMEMVKLDKQNRIRLPMELCKKCQIMSSAVIVGSFEYMQIWDVGRWHQFVNNETENIGKVDDEMACRQDKLARGEEELAQKLNALARIEVDMMRKFHEPMVQSELKNPSREPAKPEES